MDALHDALLREAVLIHPGYVAEDGLMFGDAELPAARLLFQTQHTEIQAVELRLGKVSRFRVEPKLEFRLEGDVRTDEVVLYLAGRDLANTSEIRASTLEYVILDRSWRGKGHKFIKGAIMGEEGEELGSN